MKLGSLFDGSGGFPLAGAMYGIEPVWASEIEPFPIRVTSLRFPTMKHLGSVTEVDGGSVEPVDIITFGSPCQDLSVAGKQKGIHDGERSNLFFEAIRIIKEMRNATTNEFPRFAVWENVPGAFSSNRGADFKAVLEALCGVKESDVSVPQPEGGWKPAGLIVGDGYSIAWRVYDAQYWGVPQRRKRIYLVADFGSERAGEILFKPEGVRRDPATGREAREGTAGDATGGVIGGYLSFGWAKGYAHTLNATDRHGVVYPDKARSLCARHDSSPCLDRGQKIVVYDARGNGNGDVVPTLTGDHENQITDYTALATYIQPAFGDFRESDIASALKASDGKRVDPGAVVLEEAKPPRKYVVRRLTPTECARLQGFPDWWCDGADGSNSAQYKLWGNGIALPCACDVLGRIAEELKDG